MLQDGKDKIRESLRIDTTTAAIGRRWHPGPLDLEEGEAAGKCGQPEEEEMESPHRLRLGLIDISVISSCGLKLNMNDF